MNKKQSGKHSFLDERSLPKDKESSAGSNPARSTEPSLPKETSPRKDVPPFVIVFELFIFSIASLWARRNGYL
jgi:hypothetical protein